MLGDISIELRGLDGHLGFGIILWSLVAIIFLVSLDISLVWAGHVKLGTHLLVVFWNTAF